MEANVAQQVEPGEAQQTRTDKKFKAPKIFDGPEDYEPYVIEFFDTERSAVEQSEGDVAQKTRIDKRFKAAEIFDETGNPNPYLKATFEENPLRYILEFVIGKIRWTFKDLFREF